MAAKLARSQSASVSRLLSKYSPTTRLLQNITNGRGESAEK